MFIGGLYCLFSGQLLNDLVLYPLLDLLSFYIDLNDIVNFLSALALALNMAFLIMTIVSVSVDGYHRNKISVAMALLRYSIVTMIVDVIVVADGVGIDYSIDSVAIVAIMISLIISGIILKARLEVLKGRLREQLEIKKTETEQINQCTGEA